MDEETTVSEGINTSFDSSNEVVLSIDIKGLILGASCLNLANHTLSIWEDFQFSESRYYIESIIDETKPTIMLACSRIPQDLLSFLEDLSTKYDFKLNIKIVADFTKFNVTSLANSFDNISDHSTEGKLKVELMKTSALTSPVLKLAVCIKEFTL